MLKYYFYILRLVMSIGLIGFLLVFLHILVSEGASVWRIFAVLLSSGMLISSELFHHYQMKTIARINIESEWTSLIEVRGKVHRHKTSKVMKINCNFMGGYRIFITEGEEILEYKCTGMVIVKKDGEKRHRGVKMEDFPGAKFI